MSNSIFDEGIFGESSVVHTASNISSNAASNMQKRAADLILDNAEKNRKAEEEILGINKENEEK